MYKAVKKKKVVQIYMESLSLHTGAPTVHWEEDKISISVVEFKIVTPIFKHICIPVFFLQEQFDNGIFFQNTRIPVSCRQIYAPNHFQVQ